MDLQRIGFDARYINDRYHGIGRYAFQLLSSMISLAKDLEFIVYRGHAPEERFNWEAIEAAANVKLRWGPEPIYYPHEQFLWLNKLKRDKVDLFHTPYFAVPLLTSSPVLMTVHDMIFERYPQYMPNAWMRPYYTLLMRLGLRKAQKVITVSQSTANDVEYYYPVSQGKLVVVQEGVEEKFKPLEDHSYLEEVRKKYRLESPYILSVGARRPHKNYGRLIKSFSRLIEDYPHVLVVIGPTDERFRDEFISEMDGSSIGTRIFSLEWVPEVDLVALYSLAEIVVLPSIIEGFGLPALEAMACGTPVIAADNSSYPEVLDGAGILIDPYSIEGIETAMRQLLSDEGKRQQLSQAGLKRANEFSWDSSAKEILKIYAEVTK